MELHLIKTPFPHVIIDNFYTGEELFHIWKELDFLSYQTKMLSPSETGAAFYEGTDIPKKSNYGIHLDDLYKNREVSNIMTINRKLFDKKIAEDISAFDFSFNTWKTVNSDMTLVSYYENNGHYDSHRDLSCYTFLTWLYKKPKSFSGGDMYFEEYDYSLEIDNNKGILFHGSIMHKVTDITMKQNYDVDSMNHFSCAGRYTISQFATHIY